MKISDFSWINQGAAAVSQPGGAGTPVEVTAPPSMGDQLRLLVVPCPVAGPWVATGKFTITALGFCGYGIFLRDPITGKLILFGCSTDEGLRVMKYRDPQTWDSDYFNRNLTDFTTQQGIQFSLSTDSSGGRHWMVSVDGNFFTEVFASPPGDWVSNGAQVGCFFSNSGPAASTLCIFDFVGPPPPP